MIICYQTFGGFRKFSTILTLRSTFDKYNLCPYTLSQKPYENFMKTLTPIYNNYLYNNDRVIKINSPINVCTIIFVS